VAEDGECLLAAARLRRGEAEGGELAGENFQAGGAVIDDEDRASEGGELSGGFGGSVQNHRLPAERGPVGFGEEECRGESLLHKEVEVVHRLAETLEVLAEGAGVAGRRMGFRQGAMVADARDEEAEHLAETRCSGCRDGIGPGHVRSGWHDTRCGAAGVQGQTPAVHWTGQDW
jgi:hypothetical protein